MSVRVSTVGAMTADETGAGGVPRTAGPVPTGTWEGLPVYRTGAAPEHLRTPSQLREERLKVGAGQKQHGWLYVMLHHQRVPLYDPREAEPMRPLPAGTVALMQRRRTCFGCGETRETPFPHQHKEHGGECSPCHGRRRAEERALRQRTCVGCGLVADEPWEWNRCEPCREARRAELAEQERRETAERRERMAARAQAILDDPDAVVFDTETTSLAGVIVQAAVVARDGTELFNACINPLEPVSEGAFEVHGLSDEDLAVFEPFAVVWSELRRALEGRRVVVYNKAFDTAILAHDLARLPLDVWGAAPRFPEWPALVAEQQDEEGRAWVEAQMWECAMLLYSEWFGEAWADGYREGWVWQKLPRPDGYTAHDAAADCRLVWDLLERVARN
jgi:hypothetical protein